MIFWGEFVTILLVSPTTLSIYLHISFSVPSFLHFLSLSLQWSYGFYLIHLQGKQGFQFFCKTEDTKRKWMEQFEMAMWVQ